MAEQLKRLFGAVVFIDEPVLVRAIRARAPEAQIVILSSSLEGGGSPSPGSLRPDASGGARPAVARREYDVLARVATGETNAEIAEAMGLARNTVKAYLQSAMRKLGARNRVEVIVRARTCGIL